MKAIEMTGVRFGKLLVMCRVSSPLRGARWLCACDCGKKKVIRADVLRRGEANGCGCGRQRSHYRHGMTGSREYNAWVDMRQRCLNPNKPGFKNYGGRGIGICSEWESFVRFYADMGTCPDGLSLDRIDNEGNYSRLNCRWTTRTVQNNNKRNSKRL